MRCAVNALRLPICGWATVRVCCGWGMPRIADGGEASETDRPAYLSLRFLDAYLEFEADFSHARVESQSRQELRA